MGGAVGAVPVVVVDGCSVCLSFYGGGGADGRDEERGYYDVLGELL